MKSSIFYKIIAVLHFGIIAGILIYLFQTYALYSLIEGFLDVSTSGENFQRTVDDLQFCFIYATLSITFIKSADIFYKGIMLSKEENKVKSEKRDATTELIK